jgi:type III restriction enzyme
MRVALNVRRTTAGHMNVNREAQPSETATQQWLPVSEVQRDLQRRVFRLHLVPQTAQELNAATRVTASFLVGAGAGADEDREVSWSAEWTRQAVVGIGALVQRKFDARRLRPEYEFRSILLPAEPLPMPTDVLDRYCQFERGRWYKDSPA